MIQMKGKFTKLNSTLYIRCNDACRKNGDRIEHFSESFSHKTWKEHKFNLVEKFPHLNDSNEIYVYF